MKIVQILNDIVHWQSQYKSLTELPTFPAGIIFVEAPDYVFEGWGYLDGVFVKPTPPEGWIYDDDTGTFYPLDGTIPGLTKTPEQIIAEQQQIINRLILERLGDK